MAAALTTVRATALIPLQYSGIPEAGNVVEPELERRYFAYDRSGGSVGFGRNLSSGAKIDRIREAMTLGSSSLLVIATRDTSKNDLNGSAVVVSCSDDNPETPRFVFKTLM